jgi:hypothetical protein
MANLADVNEAIKTHLSIKLSEKHMAARREMRQKQIKSNCGNKYQFGLLFMKTDGLDTCKLINNIFNANNIKFEIDVDGDSADCYEQWCEISKALLDFKVINEIYAYIYINNRAILNIYKTYHGKGNTVYTVKEVVKYNCLLNYMVEYDREEYLGIDSYKYSELCNMHQLEITQTLDNVNIHSNGIIQVIYEYFDL